MEIRYELGKRIRQHRTEKKLSQEKLAELAGLNTIYISEVERGVKNASVETIFKISQRLGINIADLFQNIDNTGHFENQFINEMTDMMMELSKAEQAKMVAIVAKILELKK